jgi:uncharacterized protein
VALSRSLRADFRRQAIRARAGTEVDLTVRDEDYRATCPDETVTIVFGGKARLSDQWVDDRYVADSVHQHPENLIGFMCLDPTHLGRTSSTTDVARGVIDHLDP